MAGLHPGALRDLQSGERAIGGHPVGARLAHGPEQRLRQLHGQLEVLLLHSPRSVHRRAFLDGLHGGARQAQDVGGLGAQVLRLEMAGKLVGDGGGRIREARVELPGGMQARKVLEEIARVARHQIGVLGAVEPRVLLLEHVGAGGARHHDVSSLPHFFGERPHVVGDECLGLLHRSSVQIGHAAAALGGQRDVHAVPLEHADGGPARGGIVELDRARGEEGHPRLRLEARRLSAIEPGRERLPVEGG